MKTTTIYIVTREDGPILGALEELANLMQIKHRAAHIPEEHITALNRVLGGNFTALDLDQTAQAFTLAAVARKQAEDVLEAAIRNGGHGFVVDPVGILAEDRERIMSRWVALRADFHGLMHGATPTRR